MQVQRAPIGTKKTQRKGTGSASIGVVFGTPDSILYFGSILVLIPHEIVYDSNVVLVLVQIQFRFFLFFLLCLYLMAAVVLQLEEGLIDTAAVLDIYRTVDALRFALSNIVVDHMRRVAARALPAPFFVEIYPACRRDT